MGIKALAQCFTRPLCALMFAIALAGCSPTPEQIGEQTKASMQQKFDTDQDFKKYRLTVISVKAISLDKNTYKGVAEINRDDKQIVSVPINITADGKNLVWEAKPGAFSFLLPAAIENFFNHY
ncbi:hypothetical protein D9M71_188480 [compost metagenome]